MFFGAYLGNDEHATTWQNVMQQHAAWFGLKPYLTSYRLADGRNFSFGWLKSKSSNGSVPFQEMETGLMIATLEGIPPAPLGGVTQQSWSQMLAMVDSNAIRIEISAQSGELRIIVPPTTPEQFYFSRDSRGYIFGNDMRLLMRWTGLELDEQAVYALFQYGTIPPPLTICQRVQRIPTGHVLKITPPSTEPAFEVFFQPGNDLPLDRNSADPERQVQQTLDDMLADIPASAALYFSGGVDSGLIAARLADLGRTDVRLINYAFGPQDPEGHLAMQMAAHLGLTCEQIMYEPSDIFLMLQRIGQDYSFPFGDRSVIPTNLLVHASLRSIDPLSTVIEGTGGDGAFGPWALRSRVASLPGWVRWLMAAGYKELKGWRFNSKIEHVGRLARKSMSMPLSHVIAIAYNPLNGIAYTIPDRVSKALEQVIKTRVEILSVGLEPEAQLSLLDLVCVCAGRFAAKSFDPLRAYGVKAIYPFLEPAMLRLSSSLPYDQKCNGGQAKALLKSLLARQVPGELIYRPKSGFTAPFQEILTHNSMQEFVRGVVLARDNPLLDFCQIDVVKQMIRRAEQGQMLNVEAHKFLWGLIFTSGWLRQLELQE